MKCKVCGEKALFKVKTKGFCVRHREEAERERIASCEMPKPKPRPNVEPFDRAASR